MHVTTNRRLAVARKIWRAPSLPAGCRLLVVQLRITHVSYFITSIPRQFPDGEAVERELFCVEKRWQKMEASRPKVLLSVKANLASLLS